jgi:hypothetical protein
MPHYRTRRLAAEYLSAQGVSTTEQGLADHASRGKGPKYGIVNGRAVYTDADLDSWIAEQLARPVTRRRHNAAGRAPAT